MEPSAYQTMNIAAERAKAKANAKFHNTEWTVDGADVVHHEDGHGLLRYASKPWSKPIDFRSAGIPDGVDIDAVHQQPFIAPEMDMSDEQTPRQSASAMAFPHPALSLPPPTLEFDFRMSVTLNPLISIGKTPSGQRNWISFSGGSWSGSFGSGVVVPGGQDSQIVHPNAYTEVVTHYLLATHDDPPAYIVIKTSGWRTGPADVLGALRDPERADSIDPRTYKFRLFITMETGDYRYEEKVNAGMWIGSGMRKGAEVIYDAYRVS